MEFANFADCSEYGLFGIRIVLNMECSENGMNLQ